MTIESLNIKIDLIRFDRKHGASELALLALGMLAEHSANADAASSAELLEESKNLAGLISLSRPSMAPIANAIRLYLSRIGHLQADNASPEDLRNQLETQAVQAMTTMNELRQRSIEHAVQLIQSGQCIASCSYSSTVVAALIEASRQGKKIRLIWPVSRYNGYCYGTYSQNCLDENGIACQLVEDYEIDKAVQSADILLLGADTVLPSGDIINGYPSLAAAKATRRSRGSLPVYCLADSSKILWSAPPEHFEHGLEKIPHEWLEGIITEQGLLHTRLIKSLRNSMF